MQWTFNRTIRENKRGLVGVILISALSIASAQEAPQSYDDPVQYPPRQLPPRTLIGPLVGHVTSTQATLWMQAGRNFVFGVLHWPDDGKGLAPNERLAATETPPHIVQAAKDGFFVAQHTLTGLKPSTRYHYAIFDYRDSTALRAGVKAPTKPRWAGSFITAPRPAKPARFTMAFSSCMKPDFPNQSSWYLLLAQQPAFHLLLGDNAYVDAVDRKKAWQAHRRQRRVPEFATVIRNLPTYAIWDDHDYGPNDSDRTLAGKKKSLQSFVEVWANPSAGTPDVPGAFYSFNWGDVEFFVLDGRYHRSPNKYPNGLNKRMLGDGQFEWLCEKLQKSKARFKVLASGSTLKISKKDGWRLYNFARQRLYDFIADQQIEGVIYLSGDIHRSTIRVHPEAETGFYDLYEVISSGIANGTARSFATLTFDTTLKDPELLIRVLHGDGAMHQQRTLKLSQLQVK